VAVAILISVACGPGRERTAASNAYWAPQEPPPAAYVLDARTEVDKGTIALAASGTISVTNASDRPLSVLAFEWTVTPARTFTASVSGRPLKILNESKGLPLTTPLLMELPEPAGPYERVTVDVRFTGGAVLEAGQAHFGLWYPRLWWDGRTSRDSFRVKLTPPPGFLAATSGRRDAASGAYVNDCVTSHFGLFLTNVMGAERRSAGGIELTAFFTEKGRAGALYCLEAAADIIPFYQKWLGGYPHGSLTILPGAAEPMGGYPYASGIVVIHGEQTFDPAKGEKGQAWWRWITAHEIGHQYWGESIMSGDGVGPFTDFWLMIGMGICADKEYMLRHGYGWDRHRGFIDGYLEGVKAGDDTTLEAPDSLVKAQKYDRNNVLIHGKGFSVLSALETVLGQDAFDRIYRRAVRQFSSRRFEWRELERIAEAETGQGLEWFFDDWVRSNKILECRVVSKASTPVGEGYLSEVRVDYGPNSIRMPVPLQALFEDGTIQTAATDRLARTNLLRFSSRAPLKEVVLDPGRRLGLVQDARPRTAAEIEEAIEALDWTGTAGAALGLFKDPGTAAVKTPQVWFKLGLLLFDGGLYRESLAAFGKCRELSTEKADLFGALVWMGNLYDLLGDRKAAVGCYAEALKNDPGWALQHDQYGLRIDRAWVEERIGTPFAWHR
jgi:tetratricopeptide (TPR) repeat protein